MLRLRERRRSGWWKWVLLVVLAGGVWVSRSWWLTGVGEFLVRGQEPRQADVVIVLAGDGYGHRLLKGAELVRGGYAPLLLVDGPYLAYGVSEADLAGAWGVRQGVPREIMALLPMRVRSTVEEVQFLNQELGRRGVKRALVVTSNFHTRRARAVLERFGLKDVEYTVVAARDEDFDPKDWWRSRNAKKVLFLEYAKLVNWWLE